MAAKSSSKDQSISLEIGEAINTYRGCPPSPAYGAAGIMLDM
jgi:hypothetical protein